jgi:hypothetical protein
LRFFAATSSAAIKIKVEQETLKPGNNAGGVVPKPERQNQKFSWLHGFLLNPVLSGCG